MRQDEHVRRKIRAASQQGPQVRGFGVSGQQGEAVPVEGKPEHQPVIARRRHAGGRGQHFKRQPARKGEHVSRPQSMTGNAARGKDGGKRFGERPGRTLPRRVDAFKRSGISLFYRVIVRDEQQAFKMIPVGMRYGDEVQPGQVVGGEHRGNDIPPYIETVGKQPAAVHQRPPSAGPFQKDGLPLPDIQHPEGNFGFKEGMYPEQRPDGKQERAGDQKAFRRVREVIPVYAHGQRHGSRPEAEDGGPVRARGYEQIQTRVRL